MHQAAIPRRRNLNRVWRQALAAAGIPDNLGLHLHDLRHTGSTWSAQSRQSWSPTTTSHLLTGATRRPSRTIAVADSRRWLNASAAQLHLPAWAPAAYL